MKRMNLNSEKRFDNTDAIKHMDKFKDGVFRYIFSEPEKFSELYKALTGIYIDPNEIIEMNLDSLVISDWHNDVSFVTKDKQVIILLEQQSTLCKNMSIRCLIYYANLIRKMYEENNNKFKEKIYSSASITLPKPEFYVLYIGSSPLHECEELLSSHFVNSDNNDIEVHVHNIDIHYNIIIDDKLGTSKTLLGYSYLVNQYNNHKNELSYLEEGVLEKQALHMALEDCRKWDFY